MSTSLFLKDQMTDEERLERLMKGNPLDRVPFSIGAFAFNCINVGYSIYDWYADMQKAFESAKWTTEQYGAMWMPMGGYPAVGPWEFGGKIKWPKKEYDQCPYVEPVVANEEMAWALRLPEPEMLKDTGYIPRFCEFARIAASHGLPYSLAMYCPWTTAGNIVGIERLCRWAIKKPDLAHYLLELATDFLVLVHQLIIEAAGVQGCFVSNSTASASNQLISPKHFKEFVLPYLIDYHTKLIKMGVPGIFLHICGQQNTNYEFYPKVPLTPISIISVSHEVDLEKASATFPDHIIMGNVEPALLQLGRPKDIYAACCKAIAKGKKHKRGFILSPGCELPPQTPPYNIWVMAKAVNDQGYYR